MSERERTRQETLPASGVNGPGPSDASDLDRLRELADELMDDADASLQRLGINDATDFMRATRQSGGQ